MGLRLAAAFGLEAAMLMGIQSDYDLAHRHLRQAEITANVRRARFPLACPLLGHVGFVQEVTNAAHITSAARPEAFSSA